MLCSAWDISGDPSQDTGPLALWTQTMAVMQVVGLFHQRLLLQGWRGWGSREEICSGREVRGAGWSPPTDRVSYLVISDFGEQKEGKAGK